MDAATLEPAARLSWMALAAGAVVLTSLATAAGLLLTWLDRRLPAGGPCRRPLRRTGGNRTRPDRRHAGHAISRRTSAAEKSSQEAA